MLEAGDDGVFAVVGFATGRGMFGDAVEGVGFVVDGAGGEVEEGVDPVFIEVGFREGFDAGGDGLIGEDDDRGGVFTGDAAGFEGGVEAVLDIAGGEDDAGGVAVGAVDGLHEVGLLHAGGHAGGGAAALDVDDDEGEFGHAGRSRGLRI